MSIQLGKRKIMLRHCIQNCQKKSKKNHCYNILTYDMKREIMIRSRSNNIQDSLENLCKEYQTSKKNILRWQRQGIERKKGCGRKKLNLKAEDELEKWVLETCLRYGKKLSRNDIRLEAIKKFNNPAFLASKAWQDKFTRERQLKIKQLFILYKIQSYSDCQARYIQNYLTQYLDQNVKQEYDVKQENDVKQEFDVKQEQNQCSQSVDNFKFEDNIENWNSTTTNLTYKNNKFKNQQLFVQDSLNFQQNHQYDSQFEPIEEDYI